MPISESTRATLNGIGNPLVRPLLRYRMSGLAQLCDRWALGEGGMNLITAPSSHRGLASSWEATPTIPALLAMRLREMRDAIGKDVKHAGFRGGVSIAQLEEFSGFCFVRALVAALRLRLDCERRDEEGVPPRDWVSGDGDPTKDGWTTWVLTAPDASVEIVQELTEWHKRNEGLLRVDDRRLIQEALAFNIEMASAFLSMPTHRIVPEDLEELERLEDLSNAWDVDLVGCLRGLDLDPAGAGESNGLAERYLMLLMEGHYSRLMVTGIPTPGAFPDSSERRRALRTLARADQMVEFSMLYQPSDRFEAAKANLRTLLSSPVRWVP